MVTISHLETLLPASLRLKLHIYSLLLFLYSYGDYFCFVPRNVKRMSQRYTCEYKHKRTNITWKLQLY